MALDGVNEGADIGGEKIGDMRFADEAALLAEQTEGLQKALIGIAQTKEAVDQHDKGGL